MVQADVFTGMNPNQRDAIGHIKGPMLVVAGAGSGKTRVITHRIANLIQHGVKPDHILAITFTNKAAGEMRERVWNLLQIQTPWITTFHSAGLRILKLEEDQLGFEHPFTILDEDDQKRMFKKLLKSMGFEKDQGPDIRYLQAQISRWKNRLKTPELIHPNNPADEQLVQIYYNYEKVKKDECVLDFDDLLLLPVRMFRETKNSLRNIARNFHIFSSTSIRTPIRRNMPLFGS